MINKIAFIGGRDNKYLGGIENYTLNLSLSLKKKGYQCIIYCESDQYKREKQYGIETIHWKSTGCRYIDKPVLGLLSTIHALLIEKDVDLFHYNAWPPSLWSWIPALLKKKTLLQGHGLEWQRTKYKPYQQKIMRFMEYITSKTNRNIIVVSEDQSIFFLEHYKKQTTTITPGVPHPQEFSQSETEQVLNKYYLEKHKYIFFLGRLVKDKNPDVLIKSFLRTSHKGIKLVIAGDSSDTKFKTAIKNDASKDTSIMFIGPVYGDAKDILLKESLVYCLPSTLEGLPISLLEAMSYGCNCICTNIPGIKEALGNNGTIVSIDNLENNLCSELQKVIDSSHEEYKVDKINILRAENVFSWDAISEKYIQYIQSL